MSPSINQIRPETLAFIEAEAKKLGILADEYLRRLLPIDEQELDLKADVDSGEFEADMDTFSQGVDVRPAYNGTYSRADIYSDHD